MDTDCDDELEQFSTEQKHLLAILTIVSSTLSVLGSWFIIGTFHLMYGFALSAQYQELAPLSTHILYWISVSDLALSFAFMGEAARWLQDAATFCRDGNACLLLAAFNQFFGVTSVLWAAVLALNISRSVLSNADSASADAFFRRAMHVGVWGSSLLVLPILFGIDALGSAGNWCWIRDEYEWARFVFFYLPLACVLVIHAVTYVRVRRYLVRLHEEAYHGERGRQNRVLHAISQRFGRFALVFALVFVPQLLNRFQHVVAPDSPIFGLYLLQSALGPLQGLGNAFVYGWSPKIRSFYLERCPRALGRFCLSPAADEPTQATEPPLERASESQTSSWMGCQCAWPALRSKSLERNQGFTAGVGVKPNHATSQHNDAKCAECICACTSPL